MYIRFICVAISEGLQITHANLTFAICCRDLPLPRGAKIWYNTCVFESRKASRRHRSLQSWETRNCVLCFSRKTTNFDTKKQNMWYSRVYTGTLRTLFCISSWVLGRASTEIQSGVRFFHVVRRSRQALKNGAR